ncbi:hypothetical protein CONPUDRAFT_165787 [Coniophora puteana RWD-64-598 SS2]|uniref:CFEM domain-containing protein n=1 Tax=Coniophora puteana (strain RWD-64-598) TaxID=741705 RepID=A0A5M3MLT5_CONPW|nr:uncharacterized protein CONPUDRAFT_165787 [Coniophora puteana RWD-64-598 SS2]EIW80192.1 hypothetical protein CONPUDRAFT_165787 [Coniophora puteana RWD-64-598 SS2]
MHSPIQLIALVLAWSSSLATLAVAVRTGPNVAHPPVHALAQRQDSSSTTGSASSASGSTTGTGTATSSSSTNIGSPSVTTTSSANWPTLSGYPTCVTNCLQEAVSAANCSSIIDVDCYCSNAVFESTIVDCTAQGCYSSVSSAESLAQQFCDRATYNVSVTATGTSSASISISTSTSFSLTFPSATPPSTSASASGTGSGGSSGSSPTGSTGGAVALTKDVTGLSMSMGVAMLGVLAGAALL